ncbi:hypothetical protein Ssi03_44980 [Sphaerisporangium siamense]|nr:hypothetical protein Ssi03_44980 [Sphaerisporangium siamense]
MNRYRPTHRIENARPRRRRTTHHPAQARGPANRWCPDLVNRWCPRPGEPVVSRSREPAPQVSRVTSYPKDATALQSDISAPLSIVESPIAQVLSDDLRRGVGRKNGRLHACRVQVRDLLRLDVSVRLVEGVGT